MECSELEEVVGTSLTERILRVKVHEGRHPHKMRKEVNSGKRSRLEAGQMFLGRWSSSDGEIVQRVGWEKLWGGGGGGGGGGRWRENSTGHKIKILHR